MRRNGTGTSMTAGLSGKRPLSIKAGIRAWLVVVLSACLSSAFSSSPSTDSLLLRDYAYIKHSSPWLTSQNAAGLTHFSNSNIAEAELRLGIGKGGLVNYYESPKTLTFDGGIESFYRISQRVVLFGGMSYENYTGRKMTGSAFVNPERLPFDIVEDSLTNEGRKHRDTYQLTGAVGVDLWHGAALGVRVDYTAANYAKYKDLRHKNKLMDLSASAGVSIPLCHWAEIGVDYRYHRYNESVTFGTYGNSDKVYKSLINYGGFIGVVEQFGNYGFTDKSREMPLFDDGHGMGVQASASAGQLKFFGEFSYNHRSGYYGRRSPYTITYTAHEGDNYSYYGRLEYHAERSVHQIGARLSWETLQNDANTYRELKNDAGSSYYEYYDAVKTSNKLWNSTTIDYTCYLGLRHEMPAWMFRAAIDLRHRKQTAYQYPYYRRQDIRSTELSLHASRNIFLPKGVLSLSANFSWLKGSGEPFEDGTLAEPSDRQTPPPSMDALLYKIGRASCRERV